MRNKILIAILAALAAIPVLAQAPPISKVTAQEIDTPPFVPAPTVPNASVAPAALGSATCYYWIVTQSTNPAATSIPLSLPLFICPTTAGGTTQNPVTLNWGLVPGATYDVLETTTSTMPIGTNIVAIATGLTGGTLVDTGQSRSPYTLIPSGLNWVETSQLVNGVPTLQWCYNGTCILNVTPTGVNVTPPPLPPPAGGGGTSTGGAGSGCTASLVLAGYVCAGPIITSNGTNPSFENTFSSVIPSTPGAQSISITGQPQTNTASSALLVATNTLAGTATVPPGFTSISNGGQFLLARATTASTNAISPVTAFGSTAGMGAVLSFWGGTISTTPVQSVLSTSLSCGSLNQCTVINMGAVNTANIILIVGVSAAPAGVDALTRATISDNLGDTFLDIGALKITDASGVNQRTMHIWAIQNLSAGSPVITISGNQNGAVINGCCTAFELSGATAYFSGNAGPSNFRKLVPTDIPFINFPVGVLQYFTQNLGADVTSLANNSNTVLLTQAVTMPTSGCPCRADIRYAVGVNSGNSHLDEAWVSDGTISHASTSTEYVNTGLTISTSAGAIFPNAASGAASTYSNGQSVTFTLNLSITTLAAGSVTAKQLGPGGRQSTWMQIAILPTKN